MEQIADWLKKLSMSEYIDRFVENHIDESRKMLRAIRDLGNASLSPTAPSTSVATEPTRQDDAERRQLTYASLDTTTSRSSGPNWAKPLGRYGLGLRSGASRTRRDLRALPALHDYRHPQSCAVA